MTCIARNVDEMLLETNAFGLASARKSSGRQFARFFNVLDHVRDVTMDDPEVVSTSGFWFPVERNPSHSKCSGDLLGNVYFGR